jgi:hypothetical protein
MLRLIFLMILLFGLFSCWPDDRVQQELVEETNRSIKIEKSYLENLNLCKSDSCNDTVIISDNFYINLNSTFLSKKSIIASHFISEEHIQISLFTQDKQGVWTREFTRKLRNEKELNSNNLYNFIKTKNFKDSKLILIPEGIWRNYYNYVISIDSLDNIRLNSEMIANEEFDKKTNSIFSIHTGGMNMITATEFKLENNQLKRVYDYM